MSRTLQKVFPYLLQVVFLKCVLLSEEHHIRTRLLMAVILFSKDLDTTYEVCKL